MYESNTSLGSNPSGHRRWSSEAASDDVEASTEGMQISGTTHLTPREVSETMPMSDAGLHVLAAAPTRDESERQPFAFIAGLFCHTEVRRHTVANEMKQSHIRTSDQAVFSNTVAVDIPKVGRRCSNNNRTSS